MKKYEKTNDEIDYIINSIDIIDKQIKYFERRGINIFRRKIDIYKNRINKLELVKIYLLKKLENEIEKMNNL